MKVIGGYAFGKWFCFGWLDASEANMFATKYIDDKVSKRLRKGAL